MGNWMLLGELAKITKISDSTARRYANIFSEYIQSKSFGRITKYQLESAAVFNRVAELYQEGRNTVEILEILPQEFSRIDSSKPEKTEVKWEQPVAPAIAAVAEELKAALLAQSEKIQELTDLLERQNIEINELKELVTARGNDAEVKTGQYMDAVKQAKDEIIEAIRSIKEQETVSNDKPVFGDKAGSISAEGSRFKLEERVIIGENRPPKDSLPSAPTGYPFLSDHMPVENQRLAQYIRNKKNAGDDREQAANWKFWENWKLRGRRKRT